MEIKGKEKRIALFIIALLFLFGFVLSVRKSENAYHFQEPLQSIDAKTTDLSDQAIIADETLEYDRRIPGKTSYADRKLNVDETFSSHLPLVVMDTNGKQPPDHIIWNSEERKYLPNEEEEIFVSGTVSIFDNNDGINCLNDTPVMKSDVSLRKRGNVSVRFDKSQYLLKLVDTAGKANRQSLLHMSKSNEWVLNGSFIDKSLLRNYLAYSAASAIMPYAPDCRFCEVIWKEGNTYQYEGVYLLIEKIDVGKNKVDLPDYAENSEYLPFLLRRDRDEKYQLILNNYSKREELCDGALRVEWPKEEQLSDKAITRITNQIDEFEQALFAEDYGEFLHYRDLIDVNSFVDYLILNEFFINYDAGFHSTYMYSGYDGKLTMGPVWDFDGAIDNYNELSANYESIAFFKAPWYRQLLRDPEVTKMIIERYQELRKSILSDQSIDTFINQTVEGLGDAIERDWARWGYFYGNVDYLTSSPLDQTPRNMKTYEDEITKIKTALDQHGHWLDENMDKHYQFVDPQAQSYREEKQEMNYGSFLAVVFIIVFLLSVPLVLRYESEHR